MQKIWTIVQIFCFFEKQKTLKKKKYLFF